MFDPFVKGSLNKAVLFCPTPLFKIILLLIIALLDVVVCPTVKLDVIVVSPFKTVVSITVKLPLTVKSSTTNGNVDSATEVDKPVPVL